MALLDKVKLSLRISHDRLDDDITDTIAACRLELIRAGVLEEIANATDNELVDMAIKTYCQMVYSNSDKVKDGFSDSFKYQLDNLRKSGGYGYSGGDSDV